MKRDLALLGVSALLLAATGGAPWFHPDSLVPRALHALQHAGDPRHYDYPALVTDLDAGAYGLAYLACRLAGRVQTLEEFAALAGGGARVDARPWLNFDLPAQLVSVLFSVLGVACVYGMARRVAGGHIPGLLAGTFAATSILWVANAHYPTVDAPLAALGAATALAVLIAIGRPWSGRTVVLLGVLLGATAAAKYVGGLLAVSVAAPLMALERRSIGLALRRLAGVLAVSVLTFLVVNPHLVGHFHRFMISLRTQLGWLGPGTSHIGYQTEGRSWGFYLATALPQGYGALPLALALLGLGRMVVARGPSLPERLALTAFPAVYFALMGSSRLAFHRYLLPLIPFLAVYSALGVETVHAAAQALAKRVRAPEGAAQAVTLMLVAAALVPNLRDAVLHDRLLLRPDTRGVAARALAAAAGDRPLRVFATGYTRDNLLGLPGLRGARFTEVFPADLERDSSDLLVFDSFEHDRYLYDPEGRGRLARPTGHTRLLVLQLSPFSRPKESVPFAPASNSSPLPPDLEYRVRPGPFVELCTRDADLARAIAAACAEEGMPCRLLRGREAYYLNRIGAPAR